MSSHTIVSQQRLTLFALISTIENDARVIISTTLLPGKSVSDVFPEQVVLEAKDRLQRAAHLIVDQNIDLALLDFMDIGDHFQTLQRWKAQLNDGTSSVISKSTKIEALVAVRNRVMHGRPLDFDDLPFLKNFAQEIVHADSFNWTGTRELLKSLRRDPSYAFEFERDFEIENVDNILHNLPSPDFDDTGFVGRLDQLKKLKRAIQGSFPIITVLGEGGLGKTSLVLKAIYDCLDEFSSQFDAVIWTTAKGTILTPTDIVQIENSIKDSLGIFRVANAALGQGADKNPEESLLQWLSTFRILLVIDNLETILDERIRRFASEVPAGSKILFTTRVGLGAYDYPIEVPRLTEKESVEYYRRVCEVYGLGDMQNRTLDYIQDVCSRLNYSPLAIKWFAQAVRSGGAPAALLSDSKLVLKFCVANVVESLSPTARRVLNALIVTSRPHTLSSLHFILDEEIVVLSNALRELRAANLILVSPSQNIGGDDYYLVKPITIEYVRNYFAPSIEEQAAIRQKQNQLSFARDRLFSARQAANVYNPNYVFIREDNAESDYVVADYLSSALTCIRRRRGDQADEFLDRAKDMSPNYFEVYRVEAFIAAVKGNSVKAESAYDRAISLRPDHAPLRSLYGGFLMRIGDVDRALEHFEEAVRLDDKEFSLKIMLARAYTRLRRFEEAKEQLIKVQPSELSYKAKKLLMENWLQLFLQKTNLFLAQTNLDSAYESIVGLKDYFDKMDPALLDEKHYDTLSRMIPVIERFVGDDRGSPRSEIARNVSLILHDMQSLTNPASVDTRVQAESDSSNALVFRKTGMRGGAIKNIVLEKRFGFIREDNGSEWFFHRNNMLSVGAFERLSPGMRVDFKVGRNQQGSCATEVEVISTI